MATAMEVSNHTNVESEGKPQMIYRCKKCRRIVASEDQIVPHERGEGQKCFRRKKRTDDTVNEPPECSSIFVEPMKWMQAGHQQQFPFSVFSIFMTIIDRGKMGASDRLGNGSKQLKKVMYGRSFSALVAMLGWVRSIGRVCSATVEHG